MYRELRFRVRDSELGTLCGLGAVVDAGQILNVIVQLFYMREESTNWDTLGFFLVQADIYLLMLRSVFIEDGLQMEDSALEKVLICLPAFLLVLATT